MNEALVYLSAILFLIAIFPVHIINYIYISTGEKYASVNVTVYRLFTLLNINTVRPPEPQNGKNEEKEESKLLTAGNWLTIYNNLCITKIVQLGDYGLQNSDNAYLALENDMFTNVVYTFVNMNGGRTKLRNYSVLNYEHANVNYYLKLVGIINIMTLLKLFTVFFWEKINER